MLRESLRNAVDQVFSQFDNQDNIQHEVNPEVNIYYNSLNLMLGQRGSGKTFNSFNEMAMICNIPNKFHLFTFLIILMMKLINASKYLLHNQLYELTMMKLKTSFKR